MILNLRTMKTPALPALVFALFCGAAQAQWLGPHKDASHSALWNAPAVTTDVSGAPKWDTGNLDLFGSGPIAIFEDRIFAVAAEGDDYLSPTPDRTWIRALRRDTGALLWDSADLDTGVSVDYGSLSGPVVDAAARAIFFATGQTVYRLNADTGATSWSVTLDDAITSAGASMDIVNASVALGAGRVFVNTYNGFDPSKTQMVALDAATGAVAWFYGPLGTGSNNPLFIEAGAQQLVVTPDTRGTSGGLTALRAADGSVAWKSSWTTRNYFWGDLMADSGFLYGITYDYYPPFGNPNPEFVKVNAADGALVYKVVSPVVSDCPPLLLGGRLYVMGDDGRVVAFRESDGAVEWAASIAYFSFRDYLAASADRLYATAGGTLKVLDPATGAILSQSQTSTFAGGVAIDQEGAVYARRVEGSEAFPPKVRALAAFDASSGGASAVEDWWW